MRLGDLFFPLVLFLLLFGCSEEAVIIGQSNNSALSGSSSPVNASVPLSTQVLQPSTGALEIVLAEPEVNEPSTEVQLTMNGGIAPTPITVEQYTVEDVTDLVLVTGQSNALGAETGFDANLDSPHDRVFAFTDDGWIRADLHQVWDQGWFPLGDPDSEPSNNFALHLGKGIAKRRDDIVLGFILSTAPGKGIDHWKGDFFSQLNEKVLDAINQMPHKSGLDGIIWHQGESDEGDTSYGLKLNQLIANFRSQSWYADDRPFICGETADFNLVNQFLMSLNDDRDASTGCVASDGLQTREDGFHFNAQGLRELGDRYAVKYLQIKDGRL